MEPKKKLLIERIVGVTLLTVTLAAAGVATHLYQRASTESANAADHIETLTSEVDHLNRQLADLRAEVTEAQSDYTELNEAHADLLEDHTNLRSEHTDLSSDHNDLLASLNDLEDNLSVKESALTDATRELESKNRRIEALEKRLTRQLDRYDTVQDECDALTGEIAALNEAIATLEADIVRLRTAEAVRAEQEKQPDPEPVPETTAPVPEPTPEPLPESIPEPTPPPTFDTAEEELLYLLRYGAPNRWYENPNVPGTYYEAPPNFIAYGYYDLTTGDTVTYNADSVWYSASLIKAPYIYSVLLEISEFEKTKTPDAEGKITYLPGEEKYNLDEIWTYDAATMLEAGSGEIQNLPDGTQMTWRELFAYVLLHSDNVAWNQIMDRFGFATFYRLVGELGIRGTSSDFMDLSANDCLKFLQKIYEFFESDSPYGAFMKENMSKSRHRELICALYPDGVAAHKYGWDIDSFHDMAIICEDTPYLIVVMTDLHDGTEQDTAFINSVVRLTQKLHAERNP